MLLFYHLPKRVKINKKNFGNLLSLIQIAVKELQKRPGGREIWRNPKLFCPESRQRIKHISLAREELHPLSSAHLQFTLYKLVCGTVSDAKCKELNSEFVKSMFVSLFVWLSFASRTCFFHARDGLLNSQKLTLVGKMTN